MLKARGIQTIEAIKGDEKERLEMTYLNGKRSRYSSTDRLAKNMLSERTLATQ